MHAAYCVVAVESAGRETPIAFLERVKDDFSKRYGAKAAKAKANGLNKEFGSKLKEHMQYCIDHPEEISKLAKVKAQVSEVKGVMMENIEKVFQFSIIFNMISENKYDINELILIFRFLIEGRR